MPINENMVQEIVQEVMARMGVEETGNYFFSLIHGHLLYDKLRFLRCFDRIIHFFENTMFTSRNIRQI